MWLSVSRSTSTLAQELSVTSGLNSFSLLFISCLVSAALGCSGHSGNTSSGLGQPGSPAPSSGSAVPASSHVFLLVEENHQYSDVIGGGAMPYLNGLASKYGLATQYFANTHPSIGNYFMLTAGQILTNNDSDCGTFS